MSVLNLSLSETESKQVTRLLSNDTARKIMDAVSEDSKSESELAKELDMPLSTVHYNVQKLHKTGLLKSDEFTYSEKGKEVRHYALASEHIVITTKPSVPVTEILAGTGLAALLAAGYAFFTQQPVMQESARMAADQGIEAVAMSAPAAAQQPAVWPWILAGALVAVLGVLAARYLRR